MILTTAERAILRAAVVRQRIVERIVSFLHAKQRAFAIDPAKRVAGLCGRRSGKSHGLAGRYLITAIDHPNETSVFIAISGSRANAILGRAFRILDRAIGLSELGMMPRTMTRDGQLYYLFSNGHRIWVAGCKNRSEAEKFRGDPYCGAGVDEADSMRKHLEYLCIDVLEPTLMDFDGWLALTGTPGVTPVGFFHDVTTGENGRRQWPTHRWTVMDNPHIRDAAGWLARRREEQGLDETSATYRREWLGEWVLDLDSLCYGYDPDRNSVLGPLDMSAGDWRVVIGMDLGVNDATAFVAGAYRTYDPLLHLLESQSWGGLSPSSSAGRVLEWKSRYPGARIVADTGGLGKAFTKEWSERHGIYVDAATKLDVRGQIAFVNGLLRSGSIMVHQPGCRSLTDQWSILPWNIDRTGHEDAYEDHEADGARYCVLGMRPNYKAEEEPPEVGSPEWQAAEEARRKTEVFRRALKGNRRSAR